MEAMDRPKATTDMAERAEPTANTTLRGRWLLVARVAWIAIAFLAVGLFIAALPYDFRELQRVCAGDDCLVDVQLTPEDARALEDLGVSIGFYARYFLSIEVLLLATFVFVAAVIFWRRSDDWMAMFVSLALVIFGTTLPQITAVLGEEQPALELVTDFLNVLNTIFVPLLFLLFPDGRFVPSWTRFLAFGVILASLLIFTVLFVPQGGEKAPYWEGPLNYILLPGMIIGVIAQVYRYRRVSDPVSRQQVKWVVFALVWLIASSITGGIVGEYAIDPGRSTVLFNLIGIPWFFVVPSLLVPVAIAVSILRYRLWDIGVVVNRALVYAVLTATLAGSYFGSVVLLQMAFRGVTGQGNAVAIVISTLAIAALFMPLRGRIQDIIDRRFFRRRYDAARTLAAFSATVRDEVDLEKLTGELVAVVENTMQPSHVSLWLREPGEKR